MNKIQPLEFVRSNRPFQEVDKNETKKDKKDDKKENKNNQEFSLDAENLIERAKFEKGKK